MAITQGTCTSYKLELMSAVHDLTTDVLKVALYTSAATLSADTTVYTSVGEVVGTGYTAGGATLSGAVVLADYGIAYASFANEVWPGAAFTARGALIYNSSKANKAICVLDFGADKTASPFNLVMPPATNTTALLRIN